MLMSLSDVKQLAEQKRERTKMTNYDFPYTMMHDYEIPELSGEELTSKHPNSNKSLQNEQNSSNMNGKYRFPEKYKNKFIFH